jgi:hypothetical protein
LLPLDGIAQNLVCLVDLLELLLTQFFILGDVRMIFTGELAEGLLNLVIARGETPRVT